jgi:MFS family permease
MGLLDGISRNVMLLGAVSFLTDVSSEMIFPVLPLFLSTVLGAGKEAIGLIEGLADSIASLLDIVFGYWSDRLGKRKEFAIAGYGVSSVLKAGLLFANSWPQVLLIRGLERVGKSIRTSPRDAIIAASSDEKSRGKAFGFHRMMDTFGAITGPVVAYLILSSLGNTEAGFRTVFLAAILPAFLAVGVLAVFVRGARKPEPSAAPRRLGFWQALASLDKRYRGYLGISCLFSLSYFSFALLILRASEIGLSPESALLAYIIYNIVYALASVPLGMLSDRVGKRPVISGSFILYALICVGFIFASSFWHIAALFAAYGIFVAADESVNKAYISDITQETSRGTALGAYNSAVGAVYLPANAIFGIIWAASGAMAAFGAAAAVAAVAGMLMLARS